MCGFDWEEAMKVCGCARLEFVPNLLETVKLVNFGVDWEANDPALVIHSKWWNV